MTNIKLGHKVRDTITGGEGLAVGRTEWLYGCVRIVIQPEGSKDGVPFEVFTADEPQLEVVKAKAAPKAEPKHGPKPNPIRRTI